MKKIFTLTLCFIFLFCFSCNKKTERNKEQKIVYLTFDDGPCNNTLKILSVLDKFNIKATFFVVGKNVEKHPEILKRIYTSNHFIGVHTYCHEYKKIYANKQNLIQDVLLCETAIKKIIPNFNCSIYRFPGGSFGLSQEKLDTLKELNYTYYDWNASTMDAEGIFTPFEIFNNVKNTSLNKNKIILLCHDTKFNTFLALEDIVLYYIDNGYSFATL